MIREHLKATGFQNIKGSLLAHVLCLVHDHAEAEDVVQEAFYKKPTVRVILEVIRLSIPIAARIELTRQKLSGDYKDVVPDIYEILMLISLRVLMMPKVCVTSIRRNRCWRVSKSRIQPTQ